jgi:hypothetical protein
MVEAVSPIMRKNYSVKRRDGGLIQASLKSRDFMDINHFNEFLCP